MLGTPTAAHEHLGVFHRNIVQECIALTRESLDDVHLIGVEETAAPDPRRIDETEGVEHQRVAFPVPDGVPEIGIIGLRVFAVRAAIDRDYAILFRRIRRPRRHIFRREIRCNRSRSDKCGGAGPTPAGTPSGWQVMTRVIFVRPHVQLLNFGSQLCPACIRGGPDCRTATASRAQNLRSDWFAGYMPSRCPGAHRRRLPQSGSSQSSRYSSPVARQVGMPVQPRRIGRRLIYLKVPL